MAEGYRRLLLLVQTSDFTGPLHGKTERIIKTVNPELFTENTGHKKFR
jgi:hypothetical protein